MSAQRRTLDVSMLPDHAFGHSGLIWWGTTGFMVIEGAMFVMAFITYYYLRLRVPEWPPSLPDPDLGIGTINLVLVLISAVPAMLAKKAAEKYDLRGVRLWITVLLLFGIANVILRGFEYVELNCRWDDNAYASMTWVLLSMHTIHIATDVTDTAVLTVLMFTGPVSAKRFVDASENSLYWYFIILWWIPMYLTIYFAPRWL
jgi:cytochrome c oxidase subunit I+III